MSESHISKKIFTRWILGFVIGLLVLGVVLRAAAPWFVKREINQTLNSIPGYYGHVASVHFSILRGESWLTGLSLFKTHGSEKEPFFAADTIQFALDWGELFHRRLACEVFLERPELQFIERGNEKKNQTSVDDSWRVKLKALMPIDINQFVIHDGLVRYKDETKTPKLNMFFHKLDLNAKNISNLTSAPDRLPASLELRGKFLNSGDFHLKGKFAPLTNPMEIDLNASLRGLDLKELNDFARAYGNFDFKNGEFDVTSEFAASKTHYSGYVKTLAKHVQVLDWSKERKEGKSVGHLLWEGLVGTIVDIFKNRERDQFAARIPINGPRDDMKLHSWTAIASLVRNGFIDALSPKFEDSVKYPEVARAPASAPAPTPTPIPGQVNK